MSTIEISLVQDPALRESLRRLYPEYEPTIQAWLIAEPGAPLPDLVDFTLPIFTDVAAQESSFDHSLDFLQRNYPDMQWVANPRLGIACYGSTLREIECRSRKRSAHDEGLQALPAYSVIEYRPNPTRQRDTLVGVVFHHGQFRATATRDGVDMALTTHDGLEIVVKKDGGATIAHRSVVDGLLADGSDTGLVATRTSTSIVPVAVQSVDISDWSKDLIALDCETLLTRWRALTSREDQARIAAFWMGHRHPVLAAAGLITLAALATGEVATCPGIAPPARGGRSRV
jgi:hypothetical protein